MNKELFARIRECVVDCALAWADNGGRQDREQMVQDIRTCSAAEIMEMHSWDKEARRLGVCQGVTDALNRHGF